MQPQVTGRRPCPWGSQVSNAGKPSGPGAGQRAGEAKGAGSGVGRHLRGGAKAEITDNPLHTHESHKCVDIECVSTHTHRYNRYTCSEIHKYAHQNTDTPPKSVTLCRCMYALTNAHTHTQMCTAAPDAKAHRRPTAHTSQHPGPRHPPAWPCLLASLAQAALILVSCPEARR